MPVPVRVASLANAGFQIFESRHARDALGSNYMALAKDIGMDPALLHLVAVIASGTLASLLHNRAVVTLLAVCGSTHRESYFDIVMLGIVSAILALVAVIMLGSVFGSF
jgi:H+/gluconate symporter-like permease